MPKAEINVPGLILVGRFWVTPEVEKVRKNGYTTMPEMQTFPARSCTSDSDEKPECGETITVNEVAAPGNEPSKDEED